MCHTYCHTGHSFIMFISEDAWHLYSLLSVWQWSCHYLFYDLGLSRLGIEHPTFPLRGKRSNRLHHQRNFENMCCKKSVTRGFSDTITRPVLLCLQMKQHELDFTTGENGKTIILFFCSFVLDCIVVVMYLCRVCNI